jgi:hypothetical protein
VEGRTWRNLHSIIHCININTPLIRWNREGKNQFLFHSNSVPRYSLLCFLLTMTYGIICKCADTIFCINRQRKRFNGEYIPNIYSLEFQSPRLSLRLVVCFCCSTLHKFYGDDTALDLNSDVNHQFAVTRSQYRSVDRRRFLLWLCIYRDYLKH